MGTPTFLLLFAVVLLCPTISCSSAKHYTYKIIDHFPHDPNAFTQGLIVHPSDSDFFIEGTGLYSQSQLRRVRISDGEVMDSYSISSKKFGEGVTYFKGAYYQLTWKSRTVYRYESDEAGVWVDEPTSFQWPDTTNQQGWGLTTDEEFLIASDGSQYLQFMNENFETLRTLKVTDERGGDLEKLNELEYINGEIWANVWYSEKLYVISPETGEVVKVVDLSGMHTKEPKEDVLNGIAYDPKTGALYVTGKLWDTMYQIEIVEEEEKEAVEAEEVEEEEGEEGGEGYISAGGEMAPLSCLLVAFFLFSQFFQ